MSSGVRFAVFLTVVLAVWAAQHAYVGWRLLPLVADAKLRLAAGVVLAAGLLSYPAGRLLFAAGLHAPGRALEYAGAVWMGALFLLVATLVAVEVVTLGGTVLRPWVPVLRLAAVVLVTLASAWAWWSGGRAPALRHEEVVVDGLPEAADGFRVAQVSDVHLGTILGRGRLETILRQVATSDPDAVAITGDLVDADAGVVERLLPELRRLRAPAGVYAVLGNHEYYAGRGRSRRLLADAGYTVLDNQAVRLAPGLWIAGVPDDRGGAQTGRSEADVAAALEEVPDRDVAILLQHAPEDEARAAAAGADLMLNGHTHGGQLWPFNLLVRTTYPHVAGRFEVDGMIQIVSRGAGTWGPPMRLGAPAEIVVVTLRSRAEATPGA